MKNTIITLTAIFFFNASVNAQKNKEQITNDVKFIELIEQSKNFYFSEENIDEFKITNEFTKKLNSVKIKNADEFDYNFENWLKNNLSDTTFKSVNEGVILYDKLNKTVDSNELSRQKINSNSNLLIEKYGFDEFMNYYNKELNKLNEAKFSELNFNCEQKLAFYEFNSYADYRSEVSQIDKNHNTELAAKKFEKSVNNGALAFENCFKNR